MTDKITDVSAILDGEHVGGIAEAGHLPYTVAVERLRAFALRQLLEAHSILEALNRGTVTVWHQEGVYVARNRREAKP